MKFGHLIRRKITQFVAIRMAKCTKFNFGWRGGRGTCKMRGVGCTEVPTCKVQGKCEESPGNLQTWTHLGWVRLCALHRAYQWS